MAWQIVAKFLYDCDIWQLLSIAVTVATQAGLMQNDRTLIVVPTYNERENVGALIAQLLQVVPEADVISMNGYIINGKIHAHMTLATPKKVIAGHLEPGTEVFTFAIITLGVMNDADLGRIDDKTYR